MNFVILIGKKENMIMYYPVIKLKSTTYIVLYKISYWEWQNKGNFCESVGRLRSGSKIPHEIWISPSIICYYAYEQY